MSSRDYTRVCYLFRMLGLVSVLCMGNGCEIEQPADQRKGDSRALAVVDGEEIHEEDLRQFEAIMQPAHRSVQSGSDAHRDHLQSLIDIKLMALEAEARGFDQDPALRADLEAFKRQAMIEIYLQVEMGQHIEISEEELWQTFKAYPNSQRVRAARILLRTREEAEAAYAEIQAGRPFEEVARERSLDRKTGEKGGAFDRYYAFDQVSDPVFAHVFNLKIGEITPPFRTSQGYEIGKVLDKKEVDFEQYRPVVQRVAAVEKFEQRRADHLAALEDRLELRLEAANLRRLIAAWNQNPGQPSLKAAELGAPLYVYRGGKITLQQAVNILINTGWSQAPLDSAGLDGRLRQQVIPNLLLLAAARQAGFADHPQVQRRLREERQKRLLEKLWDEELGEQAAIMEEAKAHYDSHPEFYRAPEETVVREILVPTRAQAEARLAEIRAGGNMGELASEYSIRLHAAENGGVYAMRPFERMVYRELMDAAHQARIGELRGPVEITRPLPSTLKDKEKLDRAYAIFVVLERLPERLRSFEETTRLSFFYARQEKQQKNLQRLVESLRRKYRRKWSIDEEVLNLYAQAFAAN